MAPSRIHDPAAGLPPPAAPAKTIPSEGHLMHRSLTYTPHMVESADGINLHLSTGQVIMDACGGAAVAIIGHGNREVAAVMADQALKAAYIHTQAYTTAPAEALADHLLAGNPFGLTKAFFVGSGSEAVEAALKLARQYAHERGDDQRLHFVSRRQGYHGNTMAAMSVSAIAARKVPYHGFEYPHVSHVSPAFSYRHAREGETEEAFAARLVDELEAEFLRVGPHRIAAFVAETVVGAASGCVAAPRGYFRGVREVCDRHGVLLVLDEVMSGIGRTGTFFAFEQEGIVPDIVTVAKGLGGGYAPIGGVLLHEKVVGALRQGSGAFCHGQTYQAHPVSCAAALAVQRIVRREGLVERCAEMGVLLERKMREALKDRPSVGDVRGRGLFWAVEFVRDRQTKEPFATELGVGARVQQVAFRMGVAVYPGSATADGVRGDHVLLAPPFNVTEEQLDHMCAVLGAAIEEVEGEVMTSNA